MRLEGRVIILLYDNVETISKSDDFSDCVAVVISDDGFIDIISKYTILKSVKKKP